MARIGLQNFLFGVLADEDTATYGVAMKPAKAISCNVSISNNDAKLYADDALAESDTSFQSGTVTVGLDDDNLEMLGILLGHEVADGVMIRNSNDVAPYVGLGRIVTKMLNNQMKYKVEFLCKVKFGEPSQDDTTKGESVEFGTYEIEGQISQLPNGDWSKAQVFDTMAEAQAYLEGLFGARTPATITYNVNGGSGTVPALVTYEGAVVTLNDGSGITPPSNKHFIGWDTTASSTSADVKSPYLVKGSVTLYAIFVANE